MADKEIRPGPSRRDKGKAKVGEPIELSSDDDQKEKNVIGPAPSDDGHGYDDPEEDGQLCFSRILTSRETDPTNPVLFIDAYEAYVLTGSPVFLEPPSASYSKTLIVFDDETRMYDMVLSYCVNADWAGYSITHDWDKFIRVHSLKAGDEIFFHRKMNTVVSEYFYYDLKYIRKGIIPLKVRFVSSAPPPTEDKSPDGKRKPGPGSRVVPYDGICLSKTLSASEVVHHHDGKPRLYLDAYEAGHLIGCPDIFHKYPLGTLLENLLVFDEDDRPYDMLLSHFKRDDGGGELIYTVDDGWQRFVRIHGLEAGDEISFYRIPDETVHYEPYYVIKYTRKELTSGGGAVIETGGPSGSGQKEA
ncbi:hypothetical protein OROHE_007333 [Orobanche hederae]